MLDRLNSSADKAVLFVSPIPTHPPDAGNSRRLLNLASTLKGLGWKPWLLYTDYVGSNDAEMRAWWGERFTFHPYRTNSPAFWVKRVVRKLVAPEAGLCRIFQEFRSRCFTRTFKGNQAFAKLDTLYDPTLDSVADRLHAQHRFSAVIAEYILTSRVLLRFGSDVLKLIDTHEIFGIGDVHRTAPREKVWIQATETEELEALRRSDIVLAIQENDAKTLRAAGLSRVATVGHIVDVPANIDIKAALGSRHVLFVGRGHPFDVAGLRWFATEVLPLTHSWLKPEQVVVAGGIREVIGDRPPFTFLGRVPDLVPVYRNSRVVIAPLHEGTGLKIKVIEALGQGKAVVATRFAGLGLEEGADWAYLPADSPAHFAEGLRTLMHDDSACRRFMAGATEFATKWNERHRETLKTTMERS